MDFLHGFYEGSVDLECINRAVIVLIPKTRSLCVPAKLADKNPNKVPHHKVAAAGSKADRCRLDGVPKALSTVGEPCQEKKWVPQ
jgi:hypothetical protein